MAGCWRHPRATGAAGRGQTDPLIAALHLQRASDSVTRFPTGRVDFNLTDKPPAVGVVQLHGSVSTPDTINNREPHFPGFPATGSQVSAATSAGQLRSTLGANLVNEFRSAAPAARRVLAEMRRRVRRDAGGRSGRLPPRYQRPRGITERRRRPARTQRARRVDEVIENTMNWLKGSHSLSSGGSFTQADVWLENQKHVPTIEFGVAPATRPRRCSRPRTSRARRGAADRRAGSLCGADRPRDVDHRRARIDETRTNTYLGLGMQRARMRDRVLHRRPWRVKPNLTAQPRPALRAAAAVHPLNNSYSTATVADVWGVSGVGRTAEPFKPGTRRAASRCSLSTTRAKARTTSTGTTWRRASASPGRRRQRRFLARARRESGDIVLRARLRDGYNRQGMSDFTR